VPNVGEGGYTVAKRIKTLPPFNVEEYLSNAGVSRKIVKFKKGQVLF
jgi:hypothetical protein